MKKHGIYAIICIIVFLSACSGNKAITGVKKEASAYSERSFAMEQGYKLYVNSDCSTIEVYNWDKNQMKLEIKKWLRGVESEELLSEKLEKYDVDIRQEGSKVELNAEYKGPSKSITDKSADIRVYLPRRQGSLQFRLDAGKLKLIDDIRGELSAEIGSANVDIGNFDGRLNINTNMGNVNISNGKIKANSAITVNMGNINVKAELEENSNYSFKTKVGNIDIKMPNSSKLAVESVGNIEVNEFIKTVSPFHLSLSSGMGKIAVRKY